MSDAFLVTLIINTVIAVVALGLFSLFRRKWPQIYFPRCDLVTDDPPKPIPNSMFGWVTHVLRLTDDEIFQTAGLDALMHTLFFRWGLKVFGFCSIYGLMVLVPIHAYGDNDDVRQTDIAAFSLANVINKSPSLWAHAISLYLFCGFAMYSLVNVYKDYVHYRHLYFSQDRKELHSVLVTELPESTDSDGLTTFFGDIYDDVAGAHCVQDVKELGKLIAEREKVFHALEHTLAVIDIKVEELKEKRGKASGANSYTPLTPADGDDDVESFDPAAVQAGNLAYDEELERPQQRKGGLLCCGGRKQDKQAYLESELQRLNQEIEEVQKEAANNPELFPSGFVTFKSRQTAVTAAQATHYGRTYNWITQGAPEARDIIWSNLRIPTWQKTVRSIIVGATVFFLVFFWIIPVAFVSALTTLSALSKISALSWIVTIVELSPVLKAFLEGFLPTLALLIFMAILPMILAALSKAEGIPAKSLIHQAVIRKYYYFQVVNVFFVTFIAGSAFQELNTLIDSPTSIISLMGTAVPKTGTFFTSYVMLKALSVFPMGMLRLGPLIVSRIKLKWLAKTPREIAACTAPGDFNFGAAMPAEILIMTIGFTFATVAPIILPFMIIFFGLGYICYRYQFTYVYMNTFESGGKMWPMVFGRIIAGMLVYQITVIGVMSIKLGTIQGPMCIPLPFITYMFYRHLVDHCEHMVDYMPMEEASDMEAALSLDPDEYKQMELVAQNVELDATTRTAARSSTSTPINGEDPLTAV